MAYQEESLDLSQLFGAVLATMQQNRLDLNEADELNHDHGDNMVDTFQSITRAVNETQGSAPSEQLGYAADVLSRHPSGSAQLYARGLSQASAEFQGKHVTRSSALTLIQTLLGGGQAAPAPQQQSAGGLGSMLGSILGGGEPQPAEQQPSGGLGDLLGTLLGGSSQAPAQQSPQGSGLDIGDLLGAVLGGGQQQPQQSQSDNGLDMGDLLRAGMAYFSTKASGGSNLSAIVNAIVAASAMGSGYREQSSSLVASTLLSVVQGMTGGR